MSSDRTALAPDRPLIFVGVAVLAATMVAKAPATIIAGIAQENAPLLSITNAEGTIWDARLEGVSYNRVAIGDMTVRIAPLSLLKMRLGADVTSSGGALNANGHIEAGASQIALQNLKADFNLGTIRRYTFFGARYQGQARIETKSFVLSKSGCRKAEDTTVTTNALDALAKQWSGAGFPMHGPVTCKDGILNLQLAGDSPEGAASVNIMVKPDLSYVMTASAEPRRREVTKSLELFGFRPRDGKLAYDAAGVLKGVGS